MLLNGLKSVTYVPSGHRYKVLGLVTSWTIKSKAIKTFELIHFWLRKSLQCGSGE